MKKKKNKHHKTHRIHLMFISVVHWWHSRFLPPLQDSCTQGMAGARVTGGHCWKQESSAGGGKEVESQVVFRFQYLKIPRRTRIIC